MSPKLLTFIILGAVFFCSDVNAAPTVIYIRSNYRGYYEAYLNEKLTWYRAWGKCYEKGGRLAVIDNTNPYDKQIIVSSIKSYLDDYGKSWQNVWIGLRRSNYYPHGWYWRNVNPTRPTDVKADVYSNDFENLWGVRRQSGIYDGDCFNWMPEDVYDDSWGWIAKSCSEARDYICQFDY